MARTIGIDIGATKIQIGVVVNSVVVKQLKIPTSAHAPEDQIISEIIAAVERLAGSDFSGIGVGVPGLVDEEKGIIYDLVNIPSWKEVHLKAKLETYFQKPVRITNDANAFAMGEKIFGKGAAYRNMVGITLGSGFGAGIIVNHKLYSGAFSSAGELGCVPYLDKTIEDYCSGKFFRNVHGITGHDLFNLAQKGDSNALRIFEDYAQHLGNTLKLILYVLSPEAILLGGSISNSFQYFEKPLLETINSFPFKKVRDQLDVLPSITPNIAVLGAAALIVSEQLQLKHV